MPRPHDSPANATGALRWIALLLLAGSQGSFAAHQLDHAIADVEAACAICMQLERDDDATTDAGVFAAPAETPGSGSAAAPSAAPVGWFGHYRSRASP